MKKWMVAIFAVITVGMMTDSLTVQAAQWKLDDIGWWYQLDDGTYAKNGWKNINGTWYYFDPYGYMETGWVKDNGTWYYLDSSGAMETGWVKDNGAWYYMDDSGAMETGWVKDNGTWYYLDGSGAMETGWVKDNEDWYYMDDNGAMQTGWCRVERKLYELYDSGAWSGAVCDFDREQELGLKPEEVTLEIPGIDNEYTFLWVSDLHIIAGTEEIAQENRDTVEARMEGYETDTGVDSADLWQELPEILDSYDADAVLLGGDMIDHASEENIACLKQGLDELQTPYMYVRADHDMVSYYCKKQDSERVKELHQQIDGNQSVSLREYEDLCVVGINNSSNQLTAEMLERIKEIYAMGKPMIIVTHVPLNSMVDGSLEECSKQVWQGRNLSWGSGCYYEPDEVTQEFLDMVYAEDSLIEAVLCGHMHFSWDGQLTENTREHIFPPSANGNIGIVHVEDGQE